MRSLVSMLIVGLLSALMVGASPLEAREDTCDIDTILDLLVSQLLLGDARGFCSSYIASKVTSTKTLAGTVESTVQITQPATAVITTTAVGGAAPTVTQIVYSNCAITGYVKDTAAYHFDGTGAYGTFTACSGQCQADPACASFAYGSSQCLLFNVTAPTNVNPSPSSPFIFYDKGCPNSTAQPPSQKRPRDVAVPVQAGQQGAAPTIVPSITVKNPVFVSSACHCLVKHPSTSTTVVTATKLVTVVYTVQTTATVATRVETVFTNPNGSPVTVTITTTA